MQKNNSFTLYSSTSEAEEKTKNNTFSISTKSFGVYPTHSAPLVLFGNNMHVLKKFSYSLVNEDKG